MFQPSLRVCFLSSRSGIRRVLRPMTGLGALTEDRGTSSSIDLYHRLREFPVNVLFFHCAAAAYAAFSWRISNPGNTSTAGWHLSERASCLARVNRHQVKYKPYFSN